MLLKFRIAIELAYFVGFCVVFSQGLATIVTVLVLIVSLVYCAKGLTPIAINTFIGTLALLILQIAIVTIFLPGAADQ